MKYRIVKKKGYNNWYTVEKKILLLWVTVLGRVIPFSEKECFEFIEDRQKEIITLKLNAKDIVISYHEVK